MAWFDIAILLERKGQSMVEYAMVLACIVVLSVVFFAGMDDVTESIKAIFHRVIEWLA